MPDRKGLNPEYNYHYKRSEFEESRRSKPESFRDGPFKRNRTLLITLLDIAVIIIIITVVVPLIRKISERTELEGYRMQLSYYMTDENLYLNLMISNSEEGKGTGAEIVEIRFSTGNSGETAAVNDLLPLPGESITYRAVFDNDKSETASAGVRIGNSEAKLKINITQK